MDRQIEERVQKTLDFIRKDRDIPEDPWFYSRLTARLEKEFQPSSPVLDRNLLWRLRPILAGVLILMAVTVGITLGKVLSNPSENQEMTLYGITEENDASIALFSELSGSFEEQIVLIK